MEKQVITANALLVDIARTNILTIGGQIFTLGCQEKAALLTVGEHLQNW